MTAGGRVLAVDLGARRLGWAAQAATGRVHHGLVLLPGIKDPGLLYRSVRNTLEDLVGKFAPGRIVFVPAFLSQARTSAAVGEALGGLQAILVLVASDNDRDVVRLNERTVRKAILGKVNFGRVHPDTGGIVPGSGREEVKELVMQWARGHGYNPLEHDEADALALLHYVLEFEAGTRVPDTLSRKFPRPLAHGR